MKLQSLDIVIVIAYAIGLFVLAMGLSREKAGHKKNTTDYFLAGKSLPWWAVGASLIAANISAEQIIGMSGSGYALGLAIAAYEWMAALALLLVAKYCLPVFLKLGISTMPQYLETRFDGRVRTVMAVFWLGVYVFVNLASVLWLGALALNTVAGMDLTTALVALGLFAASYSLYGGLKAVALTDIVQVAILVVGGLVLAWLSLDLYADGDGSVVGFVRLLDSLPEKFDLILSSDNPHYASLPGISVLVGGMWVMNLSYWGFNQYIIQRALAAGSIEQARKGVVFAAYLKILMPTIVVLPGIVAFALYPTLQAPDQAYPTLMGILPTGLLGLVFAALLAAIVSSLASMMNSISTIFTLDLYKANRPDISDEKLVTIGRIVSLTAIIIAMLVAKPLLGEFDQAFQYVQEFTGFFTPGIVVLFLGGMFWRGMNTNGALAAAIGSAGFSLLLKLLWPELPFIDRVGLVFVACTLLAVMASRLTSTLQTDDTESINVSNEDYTTSPGFNFASSLAVLIIGTFYVVWW